MQPSATWQLAGGTWKWEQEETMFIRCEQTVGNSPAEIEATTAAARAFLRAELEVRKKPAD